MIATREWSDLEDGPAGLVPDRVLADDVASYLRFRSVCRSWRRYCDDSLTRGVLDDPRLRPRKWIMLSDEEGEQLTAATAPHRCRRGFLNVSTGICIHVDIPAPRDHGVLRSSSATDGLLFLHSADDVIRLLNPLTRQVADLPPFTGLRKFDAACSTAGLADDHTVWIRFLAGAMAVAKPGDDRWVQLEDAATRALTATTAFFAGRFYGISNRAIMTVDTDQKPPRLVVAAELALPDGGVIKDMETLHLVDNGGRLMLIHRTLRRGRSAGDPSYKRMYKVYPVDLEAGKVTTSGGVGLSLGGRAVFFGGWRALSVSPKLFPSIQANTLYPGLIWYERSGDEQIGAYRIRDRSTQSFGYDRFKALPRPWTIADCLAADVSA